MASREYKGDPIDSTYQHISERAERTEVPQDNAHEGKVETNLLDKDGLTDKQQAVLEVATRNPSASAPEVHEIVEKGGDVEVTLPYVYNILRDHRDDDDDEQTESEESEQRLWRDEETLRDMYVEQEMAVTDIADELGCSEATVYNWLDEHDISSSEQCDVSHNEPAVKSRINTADGGGTNHIPVTELEHLRDKIELITEFTDDEEQEVAERIHKMTSDLVEEHAQSHEAKSCGGDAL